MHDTTLIPLFNNTIIFLSTSICIDERDEPFWFQLNRHSDLESLQDRNKFVSIIKLKKIHS